MNAKPAIPREVARQDVEAAIDDCAAEAGEMIAVRFVDAVGETYRAIGRRPAWRSPLLIQHSCAPG